MKTTKPNNPLDHDLLLAEIRKRIRKYRKMGWESVALDLEQAIGDWSPGNSSKTTT